jgi:hypothetical protein
MKAAVVSNQWPAPRRPVISLWRKLNTTVDRIFYDTGALSPKEQAFFSEHDEPEGAVICVYPRASGTQSTAMPTWKFMEEQKQARTPIDTLAVAGVGSSALGTAALCRDAADYLGRPVAGVVSGLGLADVMTEALGGFYVFGWRNAMRDAFARAFHNYGLEDHVRTQKTHEELKASVKQLGPDGDAFVYGCPDSAAVLQILSGLGSRIKLLIGHSKGNLSIENALEGLHQRAEISGKPVPCLPEIVTLGAVTWFSPTFNHLHQFLGQVDMLGLLNSRWDVDRVTLPWEWHSLNAVLPGHMSVAAALKEAGIAGKAQRVQAHAKRRPRRSAVAAGAPTAQLI